VHLQDLENLFRVREEPGRQEDETEIRLLAWQPAAQLLHPVLQSRIVEIAPPMSGYGVIIRASRHEKRLIAQDTNANANTKCDPFPADARARVR
jgi:hypothetical protein